MSNHSSTKPLPRLTTVKKMAQTKPYCDIYTENSIRALVFNSAPRISSKGEIPSNGLQEAGAILRVGRKLLIDLDAFDSWLITQSSNIKAIG